MTTWQTQIHPEETAECEAYLALEEMNHQDAIKRAKRYSDLVVTITDPRDDDSEVEVAVEIYSYRYQSEATTWDYQGGVYIEDLKLNGIRLDDLSDIEISDEDLSERDLDRIYDIIRDREGD